ncbi:MAG TPA: ATP-binding protein [Stellaceae bacterium]|nr:ATP-binding protein [Stellaceae bacterium]
MPLRVRTSIGSLIFLGFVAMGVITAALGGYGVFVLSVAGDFVADTYDRSMMAVSYARSASLDFSRMEAELLRQRLAPAADRSAFEAKLDQLTTSFFEDLGVVDQRSSAPDEFNVIHEIRALADRWGQLRNSGDQNLGPRTAVAEQIIERLDMLGELTAGHSFVDRRVAMTKMRFFNYSSFAAIALALFLSAAITLLLTRRIMRPLAAAAGAADRISQGAFDTPIPPGGEDETGILLRSMTVMQDSIRSMVEREQEQRLSAQNRLVDALESSREAIVLVDAENRIVIANSQLANFFPTIAPQLERGMNFADAFRRFDQLVVETSPPAVIEAIGGVDDGGLLSAGSEFRLAGGRWLLVSRSATQDGGFFLLISDISDIKEREARLDEARRQAEAASEAKSAFLAAISHELRTPLNAIIGFSEFLASELLGPLGNKNYLDYAQSVHRSGLHLLRIINNVLELTRHQAGKQTLTIGEINLVTLIGECAANLSDQFADKGLSLTTDLPTALMIFGDTAKLEQMFANLVSNAVKFTPSGGVTVSAEVTSEGGARIQIVDTGIGMSADEIPTALALFEQVDSRLARRYEGTGIGLPLAQSIAELHGGTIDISSTPQKGTTVTIRLPRKPGSRSNFEGGRRLERVA